MLSTKNGSLKKSNVIFCRDLNLKWTSHSVSALGVTFTTLSGDVIKLNYEPQLEKIQNLLKTWQGRDLSLIGKITIVKSLAISKLVFLFTSLSNPDYTFFQSLKKTIMKFIWNNKPAKIKHSILINDIKNGGLKLLDPKSFCEALKLSWVKRILGKENSCIWSTLVQKQLECVGGNFIWKCNFTEEDNFLSNITSSFLYDLLVAWSHFKVQYHEGKSHILSCHEIIWNNTGIQVNGKSVFLQTVVSTRNI